MPLPATQAAALATRLAQLDAQEGAAYLRHATRPKAVGSDVATLKAFAQRYEATAALAEQNGSFADSILPRLGALSGAGVGLPILPAGVLVQVDKPSRGQVTVTLDVAGAMLLTVAPPTGAPFPVKPTAGDTRQSATFAAAADGVYTLYLSAGGASLGALYVVVSRHEYALFRELSRALAFAFRVAPPRPDADYCELLACLIFAEAAAYVGDPALAADLLEAARAVPPADSPVGLYPYRRA